MYRNVSLLSPEIIADIERKIGYTFLDKSHLVVAFTHSTYAKSFNGLASYDRIEFVGDALVNFIVSIRLFQEHLDCDEGVLTKAKAYLVSKTRLSNIISELDIIKYLITGKGQANTDALNSEKVRSDLFEAITAAIYFDGRYNNCANFIERFLGAYIKCDPREHAVTDYKSRLLEIGQKNCKPVAFYDQKVSDGFMVQVALDGIIIGEGYGKNKRKAEQDASKGALQWLNVDTR
ncbi:MAG: ribonuclease III [Christensenellaceae bacterium]|jgi:ribonuclease-3|nr:ribonuclease III [Christensenellaceae bacterium]